jgi:bacteriorhodopsin
MFTYSSISDEYAPLSGSSSSPKQRQAYMTGGAAFLIVAGLLVFSGPSHNTVALQASATQAAVQAPVATVQAPVAAVQASVAQPMQQVQQFQQVAAPLQQVAAPLALAEEVVDTFSPAQFDLVYNMLSFAIACMGSATVFFFFQFSLVAEKFRTAIVITGIVTLIAFYHYIRIFNSFNEAYINEGGVVTVTGVPFNDAYRYVDWLLTVPLLLTELILVMGLPDAETQQRCWSLGSAAAVMIVLGYPGEITDASGTRWLFWTLAMLPFIYIVYTLFFGLSASISTQGDAESLVRCACYLTVISWCTYPVVYVFPMIGLTGASAHTAIQLGYSVADVIAKPLTGLLVWKIASCKSKSAAH